MIIAISGPPTIDTSGVTKKLAETTKLKAAIDPTRALCESYGFQTLYDMPVPTQLVLRRRLIQEHAQAVVATPDLICDFSVFAWLADWMRWLWQSTSTELWDNVLEDAHKAAARYTQIKHVSEGPLRSYDGFHWLDGRNAQQVDSLMRHLYEDFAVADKVEYV